MSVNKVILIGHVGRAPEVRYFDTDLPMARFSLATSERGFTTADGKAVPERTEWHTIVTYRALAKWVENYVRRGNLLYVEGKIRYRNYTDQTGVKRDVTEIYADRIDFLNASAREEATSSQTPAAPERPKVPTDAIYQRPSGPAADELPF